MFDQLETSVIFHEENKAEMKGSLHHLTRGLVVFELPPTEIVLRTSMSLPNFRINLGGACFYSGRAVVHRLIETGSGILCEATLDETCLGVDSKTDRDLGRPLDFRLFVQQWQRHCKIEPELKVLIADMQSFLAELRL